MNQAIVPTKKQTIANPKVTIDLIKKMLTDVEEALCQCNNRGTDQPKSNSLNDTSH